MIKYRKKPVMVEAIQWFKNGDHQKVIPYRRRASLDVSCPKCELTFLNHGWVDTLEGGHIVCPGDWVITGVAGEIYPCKPDIFEKTYEAVND